MAGGGPIFGTILAAGGGPIFDPLRKHPDVKRVAAELELSQDGTANPVLVVYTGLSLDKWDPNNKKAKVAKLLELMRTCANSSPEPLPPMRLRKG
jgi:hypothetical protein